jgi:phage terminase large subunit
MGQTLTLETPRVFRPLLDPARYKGAHGGRGSAKSWFFAGLLIERCLMYPETRWVCAREIQKSLDQSVKRLLEVLIQRMGVSASFRILNTHIESGREGRIIFQGLQSHTVDSIKSLEGYHGAWVEESQSLSQRSLDLLRPTIRTPGSEIWFSWNPRFPTDPVDAFLRGKVLPPGAVVVRANYRDNPWFPDELQKEMAWDRQRDPEKYAHVWLGDYERHSEARVFKNWREEAFETPADAHFYFGADWGFSVDPSVLIRCYLKDRTLYVDREVYKVGCEIDDTPALFDGLDPLQPGMARRWPIVADSARPETISYMQRHGYGRIQGAKKGPGSVEEGVTFLQNYNIVVHPRCQHTIDELTLYSYQRDKLTNQVLPVLEDKKNHVIDALRYAVETLRLVKPSLAVVAPKDQSWRRQYF